MDPRNRFSDSGPGKDPGTAAADWLIARDRGFTAPEEAAFAQWLAASTQHREAWKEAERAWDKLDRLEECSAPAFARTSASRQPSPTTGVAPAIFSRRRYGTLALAAAAALALGGILFLRRPPTEPVAHSSVVRISPQHLTLSDGSRVDLNAGSEITEHFTPLERRVRLVHGEALFSVTKNPARPFIVEAGGVSVRAVGTAFNVRLDANAVEVLVTEGRVRVNPSAPPTSNGDGAVATPTENLAALADLPELVAGQRALVSRPVSPGVRENPQPEIVSVTSDEITRSLSWQAVRLRFQNMPLNDVAAEFNQHNRVQLVVAADASDVLVAGTFRADNVEVFVHFLESGFHVTATRRADGALVLRRTP